MTVLALLSFLPLPGPLVPARAASDFLGYHPASTPVPGGVSFAHALDLGVGWHRDVLYAFWFKVQPDLKSDTLDFREFDRVVGSVPAGMRLLVNIAPEGERLEGRCLKGSWQPVDKTAYARFVRKLVERYDGDGVDDMPGLKSPVKHWQVGNEPDMPQPGVPPRKDFWVLQQITHDAVKEADSQATVLIAGFGGGKNEGSYLEAFKKHYGPILENLGGRHADGFDLHWYVDVNGDHLLRDSRGRHVIEVIRAQLTAAGFPADFPIWCTELGVHSGQPREGPKVAFKPEEQQASEIVRSHVLALASGVRVVFGAWGLMEGQMSRGSHYFDQTGLLYDGEGINEPKFGTPKLAYYAYRRMADVLGDVDWERAEVLNRGEENGVWLVRCPQASGSDIFVVWRESSGAEQPATSHWIKLANIKDAKVKAMNAVPACDNGSVVADDPLAFSEKEAEVTGGTLRLQLDSRPIYLVTPP